MSDDITQRDYLELHKNLVVIDGHCDTILDVIRGVRTLAKTSEEGHVDLVRLQEGGVRVQFFAGFIETFYKPFSSLTRALQLIDVFYSEIELNNHLIEVGLSANQIRKNLRTGKIIGILGIEGGEALNGSLEVLRVLYRLGVRFIGLTWNQRNQIADGVWETVSGGGLTFFGRQVIEEMNRLGMLIDLAHISEPGFWDVLSLSKGPVMVSHANCRTLFEHPRNLTDDQIRALAEKHGIIGLSFVPEFIGRGETTLADFLDQIDHVAAIAGTEVIGIGSDFDGIEYTPVGLEDCRSYPFITQGLIERGYTDKEIRGIMGENFLRLIDKVLK